MRGIGVNTFGLNKLLKQDLEGTFRALRETGFSSVEPMIVFSGTLAMDPDQLAMGLSQSGQNAFWVDKQASARIGQLRELGFEVYGAHLGLVGIVPGGLKTVLPFLGPFARENSLKYYVHSPQKETVEAIKDDAEAFRQGLQDLKAQGVELLFHCHYQEFQEDNGTNAFDWLLQEVPELRVELDVGWVCYAGVDVVELMKRYAGRIAILHFKDFADSGRDKDFCAIGEGMLPLDRIMDAAKDLNLSYTEYVIDQDASSGDMLEDMKTGFHNIRRLEE